MLYKEGSPLSNKRNSFQNVSAIIWELVFHCSLSKSLSFIIGNIKFVIVVVDSFMYFLAIDKAILGLPSFEVGVKMASAFLILSTAFIVSKSGSPGQPIHESFMI